jgi:hypothetical protein
MNMSCRESATLGAIFWWVGIRAVAGRMLGHSIAQIYSGFQIKLFSKPQIARDRDRDRDRGRANGSDKFLSQGYHQLGPLQSPFLDSSDIAELC